MNYKVRVAQEAKDNIAGISSYIAKDSPTNARRWRSVMRERIRSLQNLPERHEWRTQPMSRGVKCGTPLSAFTVSCTPSQTTK
jgi:plasmid stabilization system protein ParE